MANSSVTFSASVGNTKQITQQVASAIQAGASTPLNLNLNARGFTQPLGRITGQLSEFEKSLDASNARVIAFGASAGAIYAVQKALKETVTAAINVEKKLTDINVILGASAKNLKIFGNELFKIAGQTGQSFDVVADAAAEFARQGLGLEKTLLRTRDALVLTRLSGLDVVDSVQSLTAAINSFSKAALNSTEIVNKLANVDAAFAVSSADLASALTRVGSAAEDAGVSFDELIAIVTAAQQTTSRGGAVIGNSFKTIFTRLQRPKTLDELEKLGITVRDLQGEVKPAIQVLGSLAKVFDTLSASQRSQVAELVGGVFQINILKAALSDLNKEYSIYDNALQTSINSTDQALKRNEQLNKTLSSLINETFVNLTKVGGAFGENALAPAIKNVLGGINKVLSFGSEPEAIGRDLAEGIFKGLGKFISGPGLALAGVAITKVFVNLASFARDALSTIKDMTLQTGQQKQIQQDINNLLNNNPQLLAQIRNGNLSVQQAVQQVTAAYKQQQSVLQQNLNISRQITAGVAASTVRPASARTTARGGIYTYAGGGVPPEIVAKEISDARSGGYQSGQVIQVPGEAGSYMNTAETISGFAKGNFAGGMDNMFINPPINSIAGRNHQRNSINQTGIDPYALPQMGFANGRTASRKRNLPPFNLATQFPLSKSGVLNDPKALRNFQAAYEKYKNNPDLLQKNVTNQTETLATKHVLQKLMAYGLKKPKVRLTRNFKKGKSFPYADSIISGIFEGEPHSWLVSVKAGRFSNIKGAELSDKLGQALATPEIGLLKAFGDVTPVLAYAQSPSGYGELQKRAVEKNFANGRRDKKGIRGLAGKVIKKSKTYEEKDVPAILAGRIFEAKTQSPNTQFIDLTENIQEADIQKGMYKVAEAKLSVAAGLRDKSLGNGGGKGNNLIVPKTATITTRQEKMLDDRSINYKKHPSLTHDYLFGEARKTIAGYKNTPNVKMSKVKIGGPSKTSAKGRIKNFAKGAKGGGGGIDRSGTLLAASFAVPVFTESLKGLTGETGGLAKGLNFASDAVTDATTALQLLEVTKILPKKFQGLAKVAILATQAFSFVTKQFDNLGGSTEELLKLTKEAESAAENLQRFNDSSSGYLTAFTSYQEALKDNSTDAKTLTRLNKNLVDALSQLPNEYKGQIAAAPDFETLKETVAKINQDLARNVNAKNILADFGQASKGMFGKTDIFSKLKPEDVASKLFSGVDVKKLFSQASGGGFNLSEQLTSALGGDINEIVQALGYTGETAAALAKELEKTDLDKFRETIKSKAEAELEEANSTELASKLLKEKANILKPYAEAIRKANDRLKESTLDIDKFTSNFSDFDSFQEKSQEFVRLQKELQSGKLGTPQILENVSKMRQIAEEFGGSLDPNIAKRFLGDSTFGIQQSLKNFSNITGGLFKAGPDIKSASFSGAVAESVIGVKDGKATKTLEEERKDRTGYNAAIEAQADANKALSTATGDLIKAFQNGSVTINEAVSRLRFSIPGAAKGFIPNFATAKGERAAAKAGGYTAGAIKHVSVPGVGRVMANSAETVKQFPGMSQPAIMPPSFSKAGRNYAKAFSKTHGFDPYAAGGFIPNLAPKFDIGGTSMNLTQLRERIGVDGIEKIRAYISKNGTRASNRDIERFLSNQKNANVIFGKGLNLSISSNKFKRVQTRGSNRSVTGLGKGKLTGLPEVAPAPPKPALETGGKSTMSGFKQKAPKGIVNDVKTFYSDAKTAASKTGGRIKDAAKETKIVKDVQRRAKAAQKLITSKSAKLKEINNFLQAAKNTGSLGTSMVKFPGSTVSTSADSVPINKIMEMTIKSQKLQKDLDNLQKLNDLPTILKYAEKAKSYLPNWLIKLGPTASKYGGKALGVLGMGRGIYQTYDRYTKGDTEGAISGTALTALSALTFARPIFIPAEIAGGIIDEYAQQAKEAQVKESASVSALGEQTKSSIARAKEISELGKRGGLDAEKNMKVGRLRQQLAIANETGVLPREFKSLEELKKATLDASAQETSQEFIKRAGGDTEYQAGFKQFKQQQTGLGYQQYYKETKKAIETNAIRKRNSDKLVDQIGPDLYLSLLGKYPGPIAQYEHTGGLRAQDYEAFAKQYGFYGSYGLQNYYNQIRAFLAEVSRRKKSVMAASGFIPNFAGGEALARKTERSLTGSAIRSFDPRIGTYYRSAGQPANLNSLIRRDHPEGLTQAIKNSYTSQTGRTPNFAGQDMSQVVDLLTKIISLLTPITDAAGNAGDQAAANQNVSINLSAPVEGANITVLANNIEEELNKLSTDVKRSIIATLKNVPELKNVLNKVLV